MNMTIYLLQLFAISETARLGLPVLSQEQPNWITSHFPQSSNNKDQMHEFIHSFSLQWRLKAFIFPGDFVPNGGHIYIVK